MHNFQMSSSTAYLTLPCSNYWKFFVHRFFFLKMLQPNPDFLHWHICSKMHSYLSKLLTQINSWNQTLVMLNTKFSMFCKKNWNTATRTFYIVIQTDIPVLKVHAINLVLKSGILSFKIVEMSNSRYYKNVKR